jgi:hypothetical protein
MCRVKPAAKGFKNKGLGFRVYLNPKKPAKVCQSDCSALADQIVSRKGAAKYT